MQDLEFNPKPSTILHIDLNSCFATIEQQANPHLRGKPIAVAAYPTPNGCILAPSIEAKKYGVKTGMRVKDGKLLCPNLIILASDPWKYRNVHLSLRRLLSDYTVDLFPKSIDEFVLNLENYLHLPLKEAPLKVVAQSLSPVYEIAKEIKVRIKTEIGEWLTVSVGIAPNRFLAKLASNLHKPDGLDEINKDNFFDVYSELALTDLPYIKGRNAARLNSVGIFNVLDFFKASPCRLRAAFNSINSYYWYLRLRGFEIDDVPFGRRSYGNSYALPTPLFYPSQLAPILSKLVTKMGARLRNAGYKTKGVHLAISYRDGSFWHQGESFDEEIFDSREIYKKAFRILCSSTYKRSVRELAVSCFNLSKIKTLQLDLFEDVCKKRKLVDAIDDINNRWGDFVVTPARMLRSKNEVPDRIAFGQPADATHQALQAGGVKELEEFTLSNQDV